MNNVFNILIKLKLNFYGTEKKPTIYCDNQKAIVIDLIKIYIIFFLNKY